jgi:DNA-binding response OmpR family regulator
MCFFMDGKFSIKIGMLSKNRERIENVGALLSQYDVISYGSIENMRHENFLILIVDTNICDDLDAMQFYLSKIRKKFKSIPILLILEEKSLGDIDLEWFFDDFVVYPFRSSELPKRIHRIVLDKNLLDDENVITIGNLKINLKEYSVYLNGERLDLTYKEFELMRFMVQNKDVVFSRKELLNKIWGVDYIGGTRTVDVHIRRLRSKLGDEFNSIIETVRNVGYRCKFVDS